MTTPLESTRPPDSAAPARRKAPGVAPWALVVLAVFLAHAGMNLAWFSRRPAPILSFHEHDVALPMVAMVLRGEAAALALPVQEVVAPGAAPYGAADLLAGAIRNPPDFVHSYQTSTPLWNLLAALLPAVLGIGPATVRLGPLLVVGLGMAALADAGRRLASPWAGAAAAAAFSLFPVAWTGSRMGLMATGNMVGAAVALWGLVASDAFRRPHLALLAGALVALATRWGESAGDGAETATALAIPVLVCAAVAIGRAVGRRDGWSALGLALAVLACFLVLDRDWLAFHLSGQVLGQSGVASAGPAAALDRFVHHRGDYPEALALSLLGPPGALAVVAASFPFALRLRPAWKPLLVAGSTAGPWLALTLSEKAHDYYITPAVPALALIAGTGAALLPSAGRRLALAVGAWMAIAWAWTSHLDLPVVHRWSCGRVAATALALDPWLCDDDAPPPPMAHWYRRWRDPDWGGKARTELGLWLSEGEGRRVLDAIEPGAVLVLLEPAEGNADVLAFLAACLRPDVRVCRMGVHPRAMAVNRFPSGFSHTWAATFRAGRAQDASGPPRMPWWAGRGDLVEAGDDVAFYRVRAGRLVEEAPAGDPPGR